MSNDFTKYISAYDSLVDQAGKIREFISKVSLNFCTLSSVQDEIDKWSKLKAPIPEQVVVSHFSATKLKSAKVGRKKEIVIGNSDMDLSKSFQVVLSNCHLLNNLEKLLFWLFN